VGQLNSRYLAICWLFYIVFVAAGAVAAGRVPDDLLEYGELDRFEQHLQELEPRVQLLPQSSRAAVLKTVTMEVRNWIADARRLSVLRRNREQDFQFWFLRRLISGSLTSVRTHLDE
jgi:hypothetical protein